jgi:hypothetical protein
LHERHAIIQNAFPEWFPTNGDQNEPTLLKRGATDSLLRFGVSHGESEDALMRVLAGVDAPHRKADVVLAGHTHCHNEYRIGVDPASGEPTFYTDFYTFNPRAYYPTRFYSDWLQDPSGSGLPNFIPASGVTYVEVTDEAERNAAPWPMPYEATHKFNLRVPGYYNPLSQTNDPRGWWAEHRPLLLQTGSLGPMKNNQVDFAGFRLLSVKNDVIEKIHFVSSELLEKNDYRLPWEQAIAVPPDRWYKYIERSRYFTDIQGAVGSPAAVALASGETKTVFRDGHGIMWELVRRPDGSVDHQNLTAAAQAAHASSDPSILLHHQTQTPILLHRGDDGHVHSIFWTPDGVKSERLSGSVEGGVPQAAPGTVPTGHYIPATDTTMVSYRDVDDNIQTLYWIGEQAVQSDGAYIKTDEGWPLAKGNPSVYLDTDHTKHVIAYRGEDDHIHSLYWTDDSVVGHDNLSAAAEAPTAAGDPVTNYISGALAVNQVYYRSAENDLIVLWWVDDNDPAHFRNLTAWVQGPKALSDPFVYHDPVTNTLHLIYYAEDGHLHEIWWKHEVNVVLQDKDITMEALAPPAAQARPYAYVTQNPNRHHVIYRGADNQIHEIHWP